MVIVKVWCLPEGLTEEELQDFFWKIVSTAKSVHGAGVSSEKDVLILFPTDRMKWGLGEDILAEIGGLPRISRESKKVFGQRVGETIKERFPSAHVESVVENLDPRRTITWASVRP
jgi:hypothetical protein